MSEATQQSPRRPHEEPSATSATSAADEELLVALADDFAARVRRGEHPTVGEYVAKHSDLADRIRKVLSTIALVEDARSAHPASAAEAPGTTIGRYKLLERIGEGGFGVVYMAEQHDPVRRKVALKVVKPGMDSRQVLARFDAERQALAIMDHPNIARVFDGGMTDTGRPYFVMELVKGEPITSYCDTHQLSPRQRLELFVQVCDAVQHAHQKGIIHRDIKPSNVLVAMHDTTPVVKVIDFGVAKALGQELTERTLFTGFAQLLGTPLYMSPEQAGESAIDVDTRSDIYSLGVLLYELLTSTTPFDKERFRKAAQDEIRRIIREEEPPRPSTRLSESRDRLPSISAQRHTEPAKLTKLIRGELDWIVMKALEKDRARRYETASGFARDVERYLRDEQVLACPPSATYRLRKLTRRYRVPLAVATSFVLLLVVASVVSTWRAVRARRAEADALYQRDAKDEARRDAVAQAQRAKEMLDFLVGALGTADPSKGGRTVTVAEVLDRAEKDLETSLADQPLSRANLLRAIGKSRSALGLYREAIEPLTAAVGLCESELGGNDLYTLAVMHDLAGSYVGADRRADAIALYEKVVARRREKLGPDHPDTIASIRALTAVRSTWLAGEEPKAVAIQEQAMAAIQEKLGEKDRQTIAAKVRLAGAYLAVDRFDDAIAVYQQARAAAEEALGADHPFTLVTMNGLGYAFFRAGRADEAIALLEKTLAARRAKLGPRHADTLTTVQNLATSLSKARRFDDAIPLFEEAIAGRRDMLGPHHIETIISMEILARNYRSQGRFDKAVPLCEETLATAMQGRYGPGGGVGRRITELLIAIYYEAGRIDDAVATHEKLAVAVTAGNSPQELNNFAWAFATSPREEFRNGPRAVEYASKAVQAAPGNGAFHNTLGVAHYRAGDYEAAVEALTKSMSLSRSGDATDRFFLAMAEWQLGNKPAAR
jgi:serine/threonine protein kinase/tetratricopeptide (TPR) repeat protein